MTTAGRDLVIGVDGGGTWTRLALATAAGDEILRSRGPGTLVDPADPGTAVNRLLELVRTTANQADARLPVAALSAGLAGTGDPGIRATVLAALTEGGVADRVEVVTDGEIALDAALGQDAGVVLVAGTGSVAYGRAEDGRIQRCGGWGLVLGDEGSGYAIARDGLHALLRAVDGRGDETRLLPELLDQLGVNRAEQVPAWTGRADKGEIAALAPRVLDLAEEGDVVALQIVERAAADLARHVATLLARLGPWSRPVPVVFHGSVLDQHGFADRVRLRITDLTIPTAFRDARADPVTAALRRARAL